MIDLFSLTLLVIVVSSLLVAYIRRRRVDPCLRDFDGDSICMRFADGKVIEGLMRALSTGIEIKYTVGREDDAGNSVSTFLVYKGEYTGINRIDRIRRRLTEKERNRRDRILAKVHHPKLPRRVIRWVKNFFKTIRDSLSDIANLVIGQTTQKLGLSSIIAPQNKYVSQVNQELIATINSSFEELLERYIGNEVSVTVTVAGGTEVIKGVLKEYSAEFLDLWNVTTVDENTAAFADMVLPRRIAVVRHLAE